MLVEIADGFADYEAEFDFEVEVYACGAEDGAFGGEEDGGGRFEEEEGLFGALVVEFGDVVGVVAADADYLFGRVSIEQCDGSGGLVVEGKGE